MRGYLFSAINFPPRLRRSFNKMKDYFARDFRCFRRKEIARRPSNLLCLSYIYILLFILVLLVPGVHDTVDPTEIRFMRRSLRVQISAS